MISRRQLYAMGEPLGDGATRAKLGGGRVLGFGGDSSSSNENTSTTNTSYTDARQAIDNRIVNNQQDNSIGRDQLWTDVGNTKTETNSRNVYNTTTSDSGAIAAAQKIATQALDSNTNGFSSMLDLSKILFSKTQQSMDANVQLAGNLASSANQAYSDATSQATGNKSLIMVAIAVVGLVGFAMLKR